MQDLGFVVCEIASADFVSLAITERRCRCERSAAIPSLHHRDCFVAFDSSQRQEGAEIAEPVPSISEESRPSQRRVVGGIASSLCSSQ